MEEHRFACPTHVREFTRFRGHFNPSLDLRSDAPADVDDARGTSPPSGEDEARFPALAASPDAH
jgi:hypothetical protein